MDQRNPAQDANNQPGAAQNQTSQRPDTSSEQNVIIEEKIATVNGDTSVRRYNKGRMLGKGGFAKCYEFVNLENKKVLAAKLINKSSLTKSRAKQKLLSEIKIHRSLHHVHVVKFEHVFEDSESVYILLELCTNQTLNELLKRRKRLHELEVQCYTVQIVNALKYLHANKIIHRDLKLGNLFLNDKMEIKIGDFGLATKLEFDGEKKRTICGTPNYIAPEILDGKIGHSYEVDVWSLGVIIYTLLIGKPPFETPDVKTTYKKIRMNNYTFPEHANISESSKGLITKILNLDPSRRPTLDEILEHPFINYGGTIPRTLPMSTLACPPSVSYINQYTSQKGPNRTSISATKPADLGISSTTGKISTTGFPKPNNLNGTDKLGMSGNVSATPNGMGLESDGRKIPTSTMQVPFGSTSNFASTGNPNNQAMMASSNLKNETMKPFGAKGLETATSGWAAGTAAGTSQTRSIRSEVHVKKWVDYSTKYGLGYVLSNGSAGVFFNDSTKIILEPNGTNFEYVEKRMPNKIEHVSQHTLDNYPKEIHKKVVLLQHFRSYLEGEGASKDPSQELDEESKKNGMVYVKKWLKTKHAIMFRLNNKIVQVDFTDKTEIILSSEQKLVTYVNKKGERSQYPLQTAMESSNLEMAKRLKYTKDILTNMLNTNQKDKEKEKDGEEQIQHNMDNPAFEVPH